jgi:hypothetical protein
MIKRSRTRALVIAAMCLTASAVLAVSVFIFTDTYRYQTKGKAKPAPSLALSMTADQSAVQGAHTTLKIEVKNNFTRPINSVVKITAQGIDFTDSLSTVQGLATIDKEEIKKLDPTLTDGTGVVWRPGEVKIGAKQTLVISAKASGSVGDKAVIKAAAYRVSTGGRRCGFLWLAKCGIEVEESILAKADASLLVTPANTDRHVLTLNKGYNLVTLPIVWSKEGLETFWGQFTKPEAWRLDGSTNTWLDLTQATHNAEIKPGNSFWLYHPDGGEVKLPAGETADISAKYNVKLVAGWNQVGNPYNQRIQLSGDQIIVQRNGQEDLSLAGALEAGLIKNILGVAGAVEKVGDNSSISYLPLVPGRYLPPYTGFFVETSEAMTMVFSGKLLLAPGELLTATEKAKILNWINKNALDICGNPASGSSGGNPLLDTDTGEVRDQFDCIMIKHPDRPWNS